MYQQQNPYEKITMQKNGEISRVRQKMADVSREKMTASPEERARLEVEEGNLYKRLESLEKQLESFRYKEDQWQANKAREDAATAKKEEESERRRIAEESSKTKQQWGGGPPTEQK